ncbi:hypothetical protein QR680_012196 [Steinernema hermaphroditum]|uniref:Uncharacterized protein n=1 Tax=Steinernema hermaphroditum TaxID=289476 RepID=A0AA39I198_9BILA|nr:hypothetical protein QR680_012196 [Steinernema hermaphroditum]
MDEKRSPSTRTPKKKLYHGSPRSKESTRDEGTCQVRRFTNGAVSVLSFYWTAPTSQWPPACTRSATRLVRFSVLPPPLPSTEEAHLSTIFSRAPIRDVSETKEQLIHETKQGSFPARDASSFNKPSASVRQIFHRI